MKNLFILILSVCLLAGCAHVGQNEIVQPDRNMSVPEQPQEHNEINPDNLLRPITQGTFTQTDEHGNESEFTGILFYSPSRMKFYVKVDDSNKILELAPNFSIVKEATEDFKE